MDNLKERVRNSRALIGVMVVILLASIAVAALLWYPWQLGCQFNESKPAYNGSRLVATADKGTLAELVGYARFLDSDQYMPISANQVQLHAATSLLPWKFNETRLVLGSPCAAITVHLVEEARGRMLMRGLEVGSIRLHEENWHCWVEGAKPASVDYLSNHFECSHFDAKCAILGSHGQRGWLHIHSLKFEIHGAPHSIERLEFSKPARACFENSTNRL